MQSPPRAWAEVNLAALEHNLTLAAQHSGQAVMAVLKAGAYGHGLIELAKHLDQKKLPYFGVANVREARLLKKAGIQTQIYLLGATFPDEREEVILNHWVPCLSTLAEIDQFAQLCTKHNQQLNAHLALDTGMGRGGFLPHQLQEALNHLALPANQAIQLKGLGSHLPCADDDPEFTQSQIANFDQLTSALVTQEDFHLHLSNSAGLLDYKSSTTNLVRPGLMLYGASPLPHRN